MLYQLCQLQYCMEETEVSLSFCGVTIELHAYLGVLPFLRFNYFFKYFKCY